MSFRYPDPIDRVLRQRHALIPLPPHTGSYDDFLKASRDAFAALGPQHQELCMKWLRIGWKNPWISRGYDPPLTLLSFRICTDLDDLTQWIFQGNWALTDSFVLGDLCFMQQVNGGDEWLTIKGNTPFESLTVNPYWTTPEEVSRQRFRDHVRRFQRATEAQCRALEY